MYTVMDYIIAFSAACGHRIGVLNDTPMPTDRPEYYAGMHEAIGDALESLRDLLDEHTESGTFVTSAFNNNAASSAHMFLELLVEQEVVPDPAEEQVFQQQDGTLDMPADYDEEIDDEEDAAPPDEYDFMEHEEGYEEGNAMLKEKILPELLQTYERFLPPAPALL